MELLPAKQTSAGWATSLWLVGLLTALAILPVFLVEIPAMLDYPNHLARMYLLAASGTPNENPYYVVTWKLYPNLAMDIIVPVLAQFTKRRNRDKGVPGAQPNSCGERIGCTRNGCEAAA